jgi:hypothetical protein
MQVPALLSAVVVVTEGGIVVVLVDVVLERKVVVALTDPHPTAFQVDLALQCAELDPQ